MKTVSGLLLGAALVVASGAAQASPITITSPSGWTTGPTVTVGPGFDTIESSVTTHSAFSASYEFELSSAESGVAFSFANPATHGFSTLMATLTGGSGAFSFSVPVGSYGGPTGKNLAGSVVYTLTLSATSGNGDGNVSLPVNVVVPTPLPGAIVLFGSVLAGAGAAMRRRRTLVAAI